jgi:hypothetical protein
MSDQPSAPYRLPPLPPLALILELALVVFLALSVTSAWRDDDPGLQLPGGEAEWLTSSAHLAAQTWHTYGYIPLWQPYLEFGEPLIDNPFSFVLNPFSTLPSMLHGAENGIKYSVVWTALIAGVGGWVLGRVLGFGWLGRVLLAALILGKGNMHAMIGTGYFQLGVSQAYFPWVIAGTLATLRSARSRWPVVLTAVSFTLMFWAGNVWYTLPTLITIALLTVTHAVNFGRAFTAQRINWAPLKRIAVAGVLTFGLSAILFVPVWANRDRIGDHPDDRNAGTPVDIVRVVEQFVDGRFELYTQGVAPGGRQFYYSYIAPLWFVILMVVVLPPVRPWLYRPGAPRGWQVWSVGLFMIVFATIWGVGGNPIFVWLYQNMPLLGQWRFVGRALAVASFWIGVLLVMRVDGLWRATQQESFAWLRNRRLPVDVLRGSLVIVVIVASASAALQVNNQWPVFARPGRSANTFDPACAAWLRQAYPDRELTVWTLNYDTVVVYLQNRIRLYNITADFTMIPLPSTLLQNVRLRRILPEFGITWLDSIRAFFTENGYELVENSPHGSTEFPCLWRRPDALEYAYSIPLTVAVTPITALPASLTTPITTLRRLPDRIALLVEGDPADSLVVTVQETAYPGWRVWVDDQPARLESVGGQIGVVLSPGSGLRRVYFQYQPPLLYLGGFITLLTWAFCCLFLLRAERVLPAPVRVWAARLAASVQRSFRHGDNGRAAAALARIGRFLVDPGVLDRDYRREERPLLPPGNSAAIDVSAPAPDTDANADDLHGDGDQPRSNT